MIKDPSEFPLESGRKARLFPRKWIWGLAAMALLSLAFGLGILFFHPDLPGGLLKSLLWSPEEFPPWDNQPSLGKVLFWNNRARTAILGLFGLFTLALGLYIFTRDSLARHLSPALKDDLRKWMAEGAYEKAIRRCREDGGCLAGVILAGSKGLMTGGVPSRRAITAAFDQEGARLFLPLSRLALCGYLGSMLGILMGVDALTDLWIRMVYFLKGIPFDTQHSSMRALWLIGLGWAPALFAYAAYPLFARRAERILDQTEIQVENILNSARLPS